MNLQFAILEPAAAARREIGGFGGLRNAEESLIELPRIAFSAGGHGEQDMIQTADAHLFTFPRPIESRRLKHKVFVRGRNFGGVCAAVGIRAALGAARAENLQGNT